MSVSPIQRWLSSGVAHRTQMFVVGGYTLAQSRQVHDSLCSRAGSCTTASYFPSYHPSVAIPNLRSGGIQMYHA